MSSMMGTPSKKLSWMKKMNAKIKKSLAKSGENVTEESRRPKSPASSAVEIVHKPE